MWIWCIWLFGVLCVLAGSRGTLAWRAWNAVMWPLLAWALILDLMIEELNEDADLVEANELARRR